MWSRPTCRASASRTAPDRKQLQIHLRTNLANIIDTFTETIGLKRLRDLRLRLRRAGRLPAGARASRADHRHHFAKRQCLRGRPERRLESDPEVLEGTDTGRIALLYATSSRPSRPSGNTCTVFRRDADRARSRTRSTPRCWRGPETTRSSSTSSWTTPATSRSTRSSRNTSAQAAASAGRVGQERSILSASGRRSFKRDIPDAEVHFLDTGHFALETHHDEIAGRILEFLRAEAWSEEHCSLRAKHSFVRLPLR